MSIYIQKLIEAKAASRELRQTKGTEDSSITGKETRFVPTSKQEAALSPRARLKLASHKRRLAKRTQDMADDAEEQSASYRKGSSMKESNEGEKKKPKSSQEEAKERLERKRKMWQDRRERWEAYKKSQPKPPPKDEGIKDWSEYRRIGMIIAEAVPVVAALGALGRGALAGAGRVAGAVGRTALNAGKTYVRNKIADKAQQGFDRFSAFRKKPAPQPGVPPEEDEEEVSSQQGSAGVTESKKYKHPSTAKFLAYRASQAIERTEKKPTKFSKKVNKLMGKAKYSDETPAQMWREIHGNAKKGLEDYKAKRDAQLKKDEEED